MNTTRTQQTAALVYLKRTICSRLAIQLLVTLIFAGCLSPLDRFSEYTGGQVVISGQISVLPESNFVDVGYTSDRERLPEPIFGAHIVLFEDGVETGWFSEDNYIPGRYLLPGFAGTPGKTYHIDVVLPAGERLVSAPEQMPTAIGEDVISHSIVRDETTDGEGTVNENFYFNIYTAHVLPSSPSEAFLKWHVEEVYALSPTDFPDPFGNIPPTCYIAKHVAPKDGIVMFSSEGITVTSIPELLIVSREIDPSFKERHYFTVYQSSLTRRAYNYWRQVDVVANQNGSIFDTPPARVRGNMTNTTHADEEVHGYFQAVNQTMTRFYTLPDDLPFRLQPHCEYRPERDYYDYPAECINCLSIPNSSYNRPPWF